jgi:hypothetical protein
VRVWREESHLALCITAIGAVRVGFDELANGKAICRFAVRDRHVLAHEWVPRAPAITTCCESHPVGRKMPHPLATFA